MATTFKVPKQKAKSVQTVSEFLGVDFTNSPANVDMRRSPNGKNMVRDVPGKVRKSLGWGVIKRYDGVEAYESENIGWSVPEEFEVKNTVVNDRYVQNVGRVDLGSLDWTTYPSLTSNFFAVINGKKDGKGYSDTYTQYDGVATGIGNMQFAMDSTNNNLLENVDYLISKNLYDKNTYPFSMGYWQTNGKIDNQNVTSTGIFALKKGTYVVTNLATNMYVVTMDDLSRSNLVTSALYSARTFTLAEDKYVAIQLNNVNTDATTLNNFSDSLQIELGTVATSYVPFVPSNSALNSNLLVKNTSYTTAQAFKSAMSGKYLYYELGTPITHEDSVSEFTGSDKVNGYHNFRGEEKFAVHVGTRLYYDDELIYTDMNDARSKSWQFGDTIYIADGKCLLAYTKTTDEEGNVTHDVKPASDGAYIPTLTISKDPSGGGTPYESLNLLQPGFTELFLGRAGTVEYALSFGDLDATTVKAYWLNSNGDWVEKTEGTHFTVNRTTGVVTFTSAPGVSPVTGEDNVKITAYKTVSEYADRINKCTIGTLYGVGGSQDRLFVSGNPSYPNYDWFSEQFNPQYFADTSYSRLGSDRGAIIGYSIVNNYLATHKDDMERDQNIIMRTGTTVEDNIAFKVVNSVQGPGALSKDSFGYISTEPLFLTSQGIFAVTSQDITGEKYVQNRSYYLNGKLLNEENLENAYACVYNDMYWLCINNVCYILDGLQAVMTDKSMPYSTRQYCGFYRTNVPANIMWVKDNQLWFGTNDGRVCRFYTDKTSLLSYNDDGQAIECVWETPDLDGQLFFKNKTLRYLALRVESAIATSVSIYAMNHGIWEFIKEDNTFSRYFSYKNLMYSKFSYSCDATQKISRTKMRIKKVDKFRLKFVNDKVNEPFGLYDIGLEMVESGNFKG